MKEFLVILIMCAAVATATADSPSFQFSTPDLSTASVDETLLFLYDLALIAYFNNERNQGSPGGGTFVPDDCPKGQKKIDKMCVPDEDYGDYE